METLLFLGGCVSRSWHPTGKDINLLINKKPGELVRVVAALPSALETSITLDQEKLLNRHEKDERLT